jgi:hypothetical protein
VLVEMYKNLGFTVIEADGTDDYIKLSIEPHRLDIGKIQKVVFALYAFRNVPSGVSAPVSSGLVRIGGTSHAQLACHQGRPVSDACL